MAAIIARGDKFPSYEDFYLKLNSYREKHHVDFHVHKSRTLDAAKKSCPDRVGIANSSLKYYLLDYRCIHGGNYRKKGSGDRQSTTFRKDCPFRIFVKLDKDGKSLIITDLCEEHNHEVSEMLFKQLPKQRRLPESLQVEVANLLQLQANKKLVQEKIVKETNKFITLRDLSNLSKKAGTSSGASFAEIIDMLKNQHNCDVELKQNGSQELQGIFVQNDDMKNNFSRYPELIFADATYKLLDIGLPIFLLMVEDGNGKSEVVAMGLLTNEELETLQWFFEAFAKNNPACNKTTVAITDKDLCERAVIKKVLPNCNLRLCRFHSLRSFKREITCDKLGITPAERDYAKSIFESMCYCETEEKYMELYAALLETSPIQIVDYFKKNWHNIFEQWTGIAKYSVGCFGNETNNRMESFNQKIKSVIPTFSTMEIFFQKFFILLASVRMERDANAAKVFQKSLHSFTDDTDEKYYKFLTPYAHALVRKELLQSTACESECTKYCTRISYCTCHFRLSMGLPCKHILNFRARINTDSYEESLCLKRWTREYYLSNHSLNDPETRLTTPTITVTTGDQTKKPLTAQEKFKQAMIKANKLCQLLSLSSHAEFTSRLEMLDSLFLHWNNGDEVELINRNQPGTSTSVASYQHVQSVLLPPLYTLPPASPDVLETSEEIIRDTSEENGAPSNCVGSTQPFVFDNLEPEDLAESEISSAPMHNISEEVDDPPAPLYISDHLYTLPAPSSHISEGNPGISSNVLLLPLSAASPDVLEVSEEIIPYVSQGNPGTSTDVTSYAVQNIVLPPKLRKRGRPKGASLTVVGLPRKKLRTTKPVAFIKRHVREKERLILSWLFNDEIAKKALNEGYEIQETDISLNPNDISPAILDESVSVPMVKNYVSVGAWSVVLKLVEKKKKCHKWKCGICNWNLLHNDSIACDSCLLWYHLGCSKLTKRPKARFWSCGICRNSVNVQ